MKDRLSRSTSGFVLAAAVTVLFNTALACAKDAYPPLNRLLASLAGHQWTTHGLIDLILFALLAFVFTASGAAERMSPQRLRAMLVAAVAAASVGLLVWYVLF